MNSSSGTRSCPKDGAAYHVKFNPPRRPETCDACGGPLVTRADDQPESIRKRFDEYQRNTTRRIPVVVLDPAR